MPIIRPSALSYRRACLRATLGGLFLAIGVACAGDEMGPTSEATGPGDPTAAPSDSTVTSPTDPTAPAPSDSTTPTVDSLSGAGASLLPGIVLTVSNMPHEYLSDVFTGSGPSGILSPSNMLRMLEMARAKKARVVIKLCDGRDVHVKDADGNFSFAQWKTVVDRYKGIDFSSYLADGTIVGHYMIDEPERAVRWGRVIPQATIEAMAAYSKSLWPGLTTIVRVVPSWLAQAPITYKYLDAAWFQYRSGRKSPVEALAPEVVIAKRLGLGLMSGMNTLDGGNGSSGIPGWSAGKWSMSAAELRSYGTALLNESYLCGFNIWMWEPEYLNRSDIASAMADLSAMTKAHARTSCRQ